MSLSSSSNLHNLDESSLMNRHLTKIIFHYSLILKKTNPFQTTNRTTFHKKPGFSPGFLNLLSPDPGSRDPLEKAPRWREQQASSAASDTGGLDRCRLWKGGEFAVFFGWSFFIKLKH